MDPLKFKPDPFLKEASRIRPFDLTSATLLSQQFGTGAFHPTITRGLALSANQIYLIV
jgi:hypothetical protein